MDALVQEASENFEKAFGKYIDGLKIQQYADTNQGAFTLNSLVEMDNHLMRDYHFQEMVADIDKYCNPSYVEKADGEEKYYVILAGLLRGLLRECVSYYDPFERKAMIEKVYNWYRDKRKVLLDYRIKRTKEYMERKPKEQIEQIEETSEEQKVDPSDNILVVKKEKLNEYLSNVPKLETKFEHHAPNVLMKNKLKQYSTRNLLSTRKMREELAQTKKEAEIQAIDSDETRLKRKYHIEKERDIPSKPPPKPKISKPKMMDSREAKVYQYWLRHRAQEAEENLEEIEFRDAVTTWSYNRARIDEEIHRRQESFKFSSQTGIRIFKLQPADDNLAKRIEKQKEDIKQHTETILESDDDLSDAEERMKQEEDEEERSRTTTPQMKEQFLSPYHGITSAESEESHMGVTYRKGFITPHPDAQKTYAPDAQPIIIPEPVKKTKPTKTKKGKKKTATKRKAKPTTAKKKTPKKKVEPEKKISQTPPPPQIQLPTLPKRPSTAPNGLLTRRREVDEKVATPIYHSVVENETSISELRKIQLEECERIKLAFAKKNVSIPMSVIERSILIPEDLPYNVCLQILPDHHRALIPDVVSATAKKTKTKKRKKLKKGGKKKSKKKVK